MRCRRFVLSFFFAKFSSWATIVVYNQLSTSNYWHHCCWLFPLFHYCWQPDVVFLIAHSFAVEPAYMQCFKMCNSTSIQLIGFRFHFASAHTHKSFHSPICSTISNFVFFITFCVYQLLVRSSVNKSSSTQVEVGWRLITWILTLADYVQRWHYCDCNRWSWVTFNQICVPLRVGKLWCIFFLGFHWKSCATNK